MTSANCLGSVYISTDQNPIGMEFRIQYSNPKSLILNPIFEVLMHGKLKSYTLDFVFKNPKS